ncbi:hypothetical protein GCM10009565_52950 [Amycolatopsis albidoflavus]
MLVERARTGVFQRGEPGRPFDRRAVVRPAEPDLQVRHRLPESVEIVDLAGEVFVHQQEVAVQEHHALSAFRLRLHVGGDLGQRRCDELRTQLRLRLAHRHRAARLGRDCTTVDDRP